MGRCLMDSHSFIPLGFSKLCSVRIRKQGMGSHFNYEWQVCQVPTTERNEDRLKPFYHNNLNKDRGIDSLRLSWQYHIECRFCKAWAHGNDGIKLAQSNLLTCDVKVQHLSLVFFPVALFCGCVLKAKFAAIPHSLLPTHHSTIFTGLHIVSERSLHVPLPLLSQTTVSQLSPSSDSPFSRCVFKWLSCQ